jgi:hypothetical protein
MKSSGEIKNPMEHTQQNCLSWSKWRRMKWERSCGGGNLFGN